MFLIFVSFLFIVICWKFGDWRNWKKQYSTILFCIIGNLAFNFITYNHSLWTYGGGTFNHTFANLLVALTFLPSIVILFNTFFPDQFKKKCIYILFWSLLYSFIEYFAFLFKSFFYYNGWTLGYSFLINYYMFLILRIHYKKPFSAWFLSILSAFIFIFILHIPFNNMK